MAVIGYKRIVGVLIGMYVALFLFFANTDPHNLPIGLLLASLVWLFACLFMTVLCIMHILKLLEGPSNSYKKYTYAGVVSGVPVGLLLLGSIDQLSFKDVILIILFSTLVLIYMGRFRLANKIE